MHLQHDSSGIGFRFAKELHQNLHDEFHRGVVIIVQNHAVTTSAFGHALMLNFNVGAPVRVLFGLSHNGRTNFAIARTTVEGARHPYASRRTPALGGQLGQ
jgi:hypothetical protein